MNENGVAGEEGQKRQNTSDGKVNGERRWRDSQGYRVGCFYCKLHNSCDLFINHILLL